MTLLLFLSIMGCSHGMGIGSTGMKSAVAEPMTPERMEMIFAEQVEAILGPPGAIQTRVDGVSVYLLSDVAHDRVRLIAPITSVTNLNQRILAILLHANFHRTAEARYAISDGVVHAVFQHPISSLSPALIKSALSQVVSLTKTFGRHFSADESAVD
ncbi:MAG: type III secretion system chaperone [Myxococcota bacterium]